ncbi:hypothetical protein Tco_0534508 [Tanacetum coccineum]
MGCLLLGELELLRLLNYGKEVVIEDGDLIRFRSSFNVSNRFGYPSNNDKILNESLLVLKKVEGYMVRGEEYERESFEKGEVEVILVGRGEGGEGGRP